MNSNSTKMIEGQYKNLWYMIHLLKTELPNMHTQAKRARALLIASGLPPFLWEEAMRNTTWLQNQTPTHALAGKTLYEVKIKKKPHLAGLQEFAVAAYVKDLKAGKLDA